jgi:hypothetical protein
MGQAVSRAVPVHTWDTHAGRRSVVVTADGKITLNVAGSRVTLSPQEWLKVCAVIEFEAYPIAERFQ